jgi:hypothetical protein
MTQDNSETPDKIATRSEAKSELVESDGAEARAVAHEARVQKELTAHFQKLKDESRAIFGQVHGRRGVRRAKDWAKMLEKAGDETANGRFIVRCVGAERFLDYETVAVLLSLRQNLISDLKSASAANIMMIDTAVISYYNFIRVQGWIGNLSLVFERELFGQEPLNEIHGPQVGDRLEEQLRRLAEVMMPLQDRAHRMMMRSLSAIS